jgi:hypothetical protein
MTGSSGAILIVADVSGSMSESTGTRRKIDILREAVSQKPENARLIAFSAMAHEVSELPDPNGGTALHLALELAARYKPATTLVISDGQPDDKAMALAAARALTGIINVLYCGPDGDQEAILFMQALARAGLGSVVVRPFSIGATALAGDIKRLALPKA